MSFAAWASLRLPTTATGRDFFEVVVSPDAVGIFDPGLSVAGKEEVSVLPEINAARLAV
jgi:hypothetical protein